MKALAFVYKFIWFLFLLALVAIGYNLENRVQRISSETYNILPQVWFASIAPFLFGIYLSLLFIKKWSIKMNAPLLLCVSIPCLILTLYVPVVTTFFTQTTTPSSSFRVPFWIFHINHFGITSFVGGFTLFVALFGFQHSKR